MSKFVARLKITIVYTFHMLCQMFGHLLAAAESQHLGCIVFLCYEGHFILLFKKQIILMLSHLPQLIIRILTLSGRV